MASNQTYVSNGERSQLLLAHPQTVIVPHCQTWIPQQFIYPERWRCDYHIISLLMLTLLLLAHAQWLLCDDSLLSNNPSATPLQPGVPLQPVLLCPHHHRYMCWLGQSWHGKRRMLQPWISVASSPQLCCQHQMCSSHVQFLVLSIHPMDGREQKRLAPLPLSRLGHLAAAVVHGRDVCEAVTFHSKLSCSVILAPNYSQGSFWGFVVGCFFQNRLLLFVVSSAESLLMAGWTWLLASLLHLHCWRHGCCRGLSARNLRGSSGWNEHLSIAPCLGKLIPSGCNIASREAAVFGVTAAADEALLWGSPTDKIPC